MRLGIWAAALALTAAIGCGGGGSGSGGGVVSCTIAEAIGGDALSIMICEEITGASAQQLQSSCTLNSGLEADAGISASARYANGPCSRVQALGGCALTEGGQTATVWYYQDGSSSPTDIATLCAGIGATYVAPN